MARPKRVFSDEEQQKIEQYARDNCYDRTISTALGIPIMTLKRRFGTKIRVWRAQGKVELRESQRKLSKISSDMAKFLGKNVLGQVDKQVIVDEKPKPTLEADERIEYERAARNIIKLRQAKTGS